MATPSVSAVLGAPAADSNALVWRFGGEWGENGDSAAARVATPTASAVLGTPELAAAIDACTELFPGVPASKENVQPMWDYMCKLSEQNEVLLIKDDSREVMLAGLRCGHGKKSTFKLRAKVEGPIEPVRGVDPNPHRMALRAWIDDKSFDWSIDGFIKALAWAKDVAGKVRRGDFCSRCRIDGYTTDENGRIAQHACKKLCRHPLPYCVRCSVEMALGEPPVKRARQ